jgi:alpha-D-xyloside xylohydrolase
MKTHVSTDNNNLFWRLNGEILKVEPWGLDGARVRATNTNGKLRAEIWPDGTLHFLTPSAGPLLQEPEPIFNKPPARWYRPHSSDLSKRGGAFRAQRGERIFGLGQHQHGLLNNKGSVIDLEQRNTEVCIPFYVSSLGYGFLVEQPRRGAGGAGRKHDALGDGSHARHRLRTFGGRYPAEILEKYADATGHAPLLPEFALGSGSASCATAPRKSCWRWCANTSGAACRWR